MGQIPLSTGSRASVQLDRAAVWRLTFEGLRNTLRLYGVVLATFLYSLTGGMLVVLATGRAEQIAWKFLQLMGSAVFAIACLLVLWPMVSDEAVNGWVMRLGVLLALASATVIVLAPFAETASKAFRVVCGLGGLVGLSAGCVSVAALVGPSFGTPFFTAGLIIGQALSGILLGSITITWLLGHAYLTATRMTIAPLGHFSRILLWAVAVRGGFLLLSIAVAWMTSNNAGPPILARIADAWIVVLLRVGVGLVAVGVFALMVRACVRLRATQSATGILYFGSLFAYIGELANQHLVIAWAWPM